MSEELSVTVNRLVELTKQIAEAKKDIKILTQAEKALRAQVQIRHRYNQSQEGKNQFKALET